LRDRCQRYTARRGISFLLTAGCARRGKKNGDPGERSSAGHPDGKRHFTSDSGRLSRPTSRDRGRRAARQRPFSLPWRESGAVVRRPHATYRLSIRWNGVGWGGEEREGEREREKGWRLRLAASRDPHPPDDRPPLRDYLRRWFFFRHPYPSFFHGAFSREGGEPSSRGASLAAGDPPFQRALASVLRGDVFYTSRSKPAYRPDTYSAA